MSAIKSRIAAFESAAKTPDATPTGPRKPPIRLVEEPEDAASSNDAQSQSLLDTNSPPHISSLIQTLEPSRSPSPAPSTDFVNISPPRGMPPPLPPRKASEDQNDVASSSPSSSQLRPSPSTSFSSYSRLTPSSSLSVQHSYLPELAGKASHGRHAYANSTSSFHSVSLSDAVEDLGGSFETLSPPRSVIEPMILDPPTSTPPIQVVVPALPPRPTTSLPPQPLAVPYAVRSKPPPPPPPASRNKTVQRCE